MDVQLTVEEAAILEEIRMCLHSATPGKRKVSSALLSPPENSSSGSLSASSVSSGSVKFQSFTTAKDFTLDLPETLDSIDGLEFIGFVNQTAVHIFQNYASRRNPATNPNDLFSFVTGHIAQMTLQSFSGLSHSQTMSRLGVRQDIQDAILNPRFARLFGTQTLRFWLEDTLRVNYLTAGQLLRRLKNHATITLSKKKGKKRAKLEGAFDIASTSKEEETETAENIPNVTLSAESTENLFKHCIVVETAPSTLQNHTVLYKGKSAAELLESDWRFIQSDGTFDMRRLYSYLGGDFNARNEAHYWSPEKETAEEYRLYAAERSKLSETWLIRIQVPNGFLASLHQEQLWYSRDWKEYVWWCKNKKVPPPKFDHLSQKADLIKGHICWAVAAQIARIKPEEVQDKISENDVMQISTGKATQWVFMKDESIARLAEIIRGKVYVEVNGPLEGQIK